MSKLEKLAASLLMWECGLKHSVIVSYYLVTYVTPYVGVWIETVKKLAKPQTPNSHSLCGSVD